MSADHGPPRPHAPEPASPRATPRALLLTDVVDSTKLTEALGDDAMADLWAAHDRVARDLLPLHDGREIDKTDGFLLLFASARDAVAYAVAYHAALRGLDLQARAGLHVGPVILRENRKSDVARGAKPLEVEGLAKPTAARVMALATGGQTLLTADALAALGPTSLRVESHGHWRMKGVAEPIEIFEIGDAAAPFVPPADAAKVYRVVRAAELWLPAREVRRHLPAPRDAFVGRAADLQELARRLDDGARLVSVLGIGGTGKTRLVTQFAWTWLGDFPGGAWFCDLSEARSVDGIVAAVARALDVPLGKDDAIAQLGHAIAGRGPCLVLLDNFEQVARFAPETLGQWLDRATEAQFVVTSREVLGLPGEAAVALAPLPLDEGVALFEARAALARRDFTLNEADRPQVEALLRLLDGLPLAIELAAARVRVMTPSQILERMGERFRLLTSAGGRHTRQATLRAMIDWSWDLLSPDERAALAQVSVFEGGFTLDAAEAVLALADAWPIDAVQSLVDKSLVRRVSDDRFDLLVSVQEYAAEQLRASGARAEADARHGRYYATYGEPGSLDALDRRGGDDRRRALNLELDNLVAASKRAAARGDGPLAAATLRAAWAVWELRGPFPVAVDLASEVLAVADLPPSARAATAWVRAEACARLGRWAEAEAHGEAALALSREVGDRRAESVVLASLGHLLRQRGRLDEAQRRLDEALASSREVGDRGHEGAVLARLGSLSGTCGRLAQARVHFEDALAVTREIGDRRTEGKVLALLGNTHRQQGSFDEARVAYDAALEVLREVGDRTAEGAALGNLAVLCSWREQFDEAGAHVRAALVIHREVGERAAEGVELGRLATLDLEAGRLDPAHAHLTAALAIHRQVGNRHGEGVILGYLGRVAAMQGRPAEAEARLGAAVALHREIGNRPSEGVTRASLGEWLAAQGRLEEACAELEEAVEIHRAVGNPRYASEALARLGTARFERGQTDEALACYEAAESGLRAIAARRELAMLLCDRARLDCAQGRRDAAAARLTEAEAIAASGAPLTGELARKLEQCRAAMAPG